MDTTEIEKIIHDRLEEQIRDTQTTQSIAEQAKI